MEQVPTLTVALMFTLLPTTTELKGVILYWLLPSEVTVQFGAFHIIDGDEQPPELVFNVTLMSPPLQIKVCGFPPYNGSDIEALRSVRVTVFVIVLTYL